MSRPTAYLRDAGTNEDPCYVPCAQGDDGSLGVYTLDQISAFNAELVAALTECATRFEKALIHSGSDPEFAAEAVKQYRALTKAAS